MQSGHFCHKVLGQTFVNSGGVQKHTILMCSKILVASALYVEQELGFLKFIVVFRGYGSGM